MMFVFFYQEDRCYSNGRSISTIRDRYASSLGRKWASGSHTRRKSVSNFYYEPLKPLNFDNYIDIIG